MKWIKGIAVGLVCAGLYTLPAPAAFPFSTNAPGALLNYWAFSDTNWLSVYDYAPVSFTNLVNVPDSGYGNCLRLDSTNAAWLQYNVFESDGWTNLSVAHGSLMFWFSPSWSSTSQGGSGLNGWGRFVEAGSYTDDASYGWWSLYTDPEGANLYFSAQTNDGAQATYLSVPIAWNSNDWHCVALVYNPTNTALYLDGALVTNGPGVTVFPGLDVLTNGFWIGSDSNGLCQARGSFDDLHTYNFPLSDSTIYLDYALFSISYYGGGYAYRVSQAPSAASSNAIAFQAVTGPGYLSYVGPSASCASSSNIWFTNVTAAFAGNRATMNISFTIMGGSNDVLYDVFANALIGPTNNTNCQWVWMGQGTHCSTYTLTNLPVLSAYLILGQPTDSDQDGLTDAYELLSSHTDPHNPDTDGDAISDADEVLLKTNPLVSDPAIPITGVIQACPQ